MLIVCFTHMRILVVYCNFLSVPLITPLVSVIDGQLISLNISINVSIFTISSSHNE